MMNPLHLRTFLVVGRHQSFTGAAKELSLSQPSVSRQIQQLEEELGVRLFTFIGKTPHLTDAGVVLAKEAGLVLGALDRAADAVKTHESKVLGTLRVGASTTPGFYLLPEALSRFSQQYPDVKVEYSVEDSAQIQHMLTRNEIDVGFVGSDVTRGDIASTPLIDDQLVCFVSSQHALARLTCVSAQDLRNELAVIRHKGSASQRFFETWLRENNVRLTRTIEVHCSEALKLLVKSGLGFGFMSLRGIQDDLDAKTLRLLPIEGLRFHRTLQVVRVANSSPSAATNAFLAIVQECLPASVSGS